MTPQALNAIIYDFAPNWGDVMERAWWSRKEPQDNLEDCFWDGAQGGVRFLASEFNLAPEPLLHPECGWKEKLLAWRSGASAHLLRDPKANFILGWRYGMYHAAIKVLEDEAARCSKFWKKCRP